MRALTCAPKGGSYQITIGNNLLSKADEFFDLHRKVLIVTDNGVPQEYAKQVAERCAQAEIFVFPQGEQSKNFSILQEILKKMLDFSMTRKDCVVALGGGVVGDMTGLAASLYMRGVDFYNIPTTLLSQVDSSVGGKTAIDFCGVKNIVGAFYQPKGVLISVDTLKTLSRRLLACGLAEMVKMAVCMDKAFFEFLEKAELSDETLEEMIYRAVQIKSKVVEQDEKETGLRKVLNFGHTLGHGVEAAAKNLLHGECVAIGMMPMCAENVKARLEPLLQKWGLPTAYGGKKDEIYRYAVHDKKSSEKGVDAVFVDEIGQFNIEKIPFERLQSLVEKL